MRSNPRVQQSFGTAARIPDLGARVAGQGPARLVSWTAGRLKYPYFSPDDSLDPVPEGRGPDHGPDFNFNRIGGQMDNTVLRFLPSVGQLLEDATLSTLISDLDRNWMTRLVQSEVDAERLRLQTLEDPGDLDKTVLRRRILDRILSRRAALLGPAMKRVINATGVVVHTNIGRSLYSDEAAEAMARTARRNVDLEIDLDSGRRGHRGRSVEAKAALLTGAADALVVNNNAAALWLAVRACAGAGRVLLSRGEVVAIGGSFRLHEILAETGCDLVEVGTTNRTTIDDYARALAPDVVVLKVHRSNFAVSGFTEEADLAELGALCRDRGNILIYDAGSGQLQDMSRFGLPAGETLERDLAAGPDIVTCSGDKLLGGGQAGLALGRADLIDRMRSHPIRRALRVDKTTLAALDAVLISYLRGDQLRKTPTLAFLDRSVDTLERMAGALEADLADDLPGGWRMEIIPSRASVGGGSYADAVLESRMLLITGPHAALEACHAALRRSDPAVLGRITQDGLGFDMRALPDDDRPLLADAVRRVWRATGERNRGDGRPER